MDNRVLWLLDNDVESRAFERLCTSLMYRWGYRKIVPFGRTADRGRDAETLVSFGEEGATRVFFQYTLEKAWEAKLKRELAKVRAYGQEIGKYVFVTRMDVTGTKKDRLAAIAKNDFGWKLEIFDREWLRHQLEEAHPSLAEKYLGLKQQHSPGDSLVQLPELDTLSAQQLSSIYDDEQYEEAIVRLRRALGDGQFPSDEIWAALAWCYYELENYRDALACITTALKASPSSHRYRSIRGCILCEHGLATNSRELLVAAKHVLMPLTDASTTYCDFFNLGNALSGLGEYSAARAAYLEAINFSEHVAEIWKNLGTCYYHLGSHEEELRCYERALELNPGLSPALVSKANTTAQVTREHGEALLLFEKAELANADVSREWPHFRWWKSLHLLQLDRPDDALASIEKGLTEDPAHRGLHALMARTLATLWRRDTKYHQQARAFFSMRIEIDPTETPSWMELAGMNICDNQIDDAYECVMRILANHCGENEHFPLACLKRLVEVGELPNVVQCLAIYLRYRDIRPVAELREFFAGHASGYSHLLAGLCLSFTRAWSALPVAPAQSSDLLTFFEKVWVIAGELVRRISTCVAHDHNDDDQSAKITILSEMVIGLPHAMFFEACWLCGYLPALGGLKDKLFEDVNARFLEEKSLSVWQADQISNVLEPLNDVWALLPKGNAPLS